tara:strand:+ start:251 stop:670 length:420 start_codon:yes stop_codon:yes gene_type:complete
MEKTRKRVVLFFVGLLLVAGCGCGAARHGPAYGGLRTILVRSLIDQHFIVVINENTIAIDLLVNGTQYAALRPGRTYTHVVETSRLSGRNVRSELVITAIGTYPDGTIGTYTREVSVYSNRYSAETRSRQVRVRLRRVR